MGKLIPKKESRKELKSVDNSNQAVRAALAIREKLEFEFKGNLFQFPSVIEDKFIVGNKLDGGSFGTIFLIQDSQTYENHVVKVVSKSPHLVIFIQIT